MFEFVDKEYRTEVFSEFKMLVKDALKKVHQIRYLENIPDIKSIDLFICHLHDPQSKVQSYVKMLIKGLIIKLALFTVLTCKIYSYIYCIARHHAFIT